MHFRKFSPIDRESPIFELVDGVVVLFDVSKNDQGVLEVAFHEGSTGRVLEFELLQELLAKGRKLAENE